MDSEPLVRRLTGLGCAQEVEELPHRLGQLLLATVYLRTERIVEAVRTTGPVRGLPASQAAPTEVVELC